MKNTFDYLITDSTGRIGLLMGKNLCPVGGSTLAQPVLWIDVGDMLDAPKTAAHLAAALALYDDITDGSKNHEMTILAAVNGFAHWRCTSSDSNRNWKRRDGQLCEFDGFDGTLWDALSAVDKAKPYNRKEG